MTDNAIESIEDYAFRGLNNLVSLNLTGNSLDGIPAALRDLEKLESLDLSDNNVLEIKEDSLAGLASLKYLNLRYVSYTVKTVAKALFGQRFPMPPY